MSTDICERNGRDIAQSVLSRPVGKAGIYRMSAITIENELVHYEVLGRGRPVILLHGWLGSWRYWVPAMRQLAGKYRIYAIDLWGFGDSGRNTDFYKFDAQVKLLGEFMERLGIKKAALIGHDLGAAVAARYAVLHPERVPKLMAIAPPLFHLAPATRALTQNPTPPALQAAASSKAGQLHPPAPKPDAKSALAAPSRKPDEKEMMAEAETLPFRTDEMRARIRAELERQANALTAQDPNAPADAPKSPREAATPPTHVEAKEVTGTPTPPPALPEVPTMPKMDYEPGTTTMSIMLQNPLKDHLGTTNRVELLKKHVDPGPDRDKLQVEVEKADPLAVAGLIDGFGAVDTLRDLVRLTMPTLVLSGKEDMFLRSPDERMVKTLTEGRANCHVLLLENTRHFPMLEEKAAFNRLVMEFLDTADVRTVKPTEIWERRVR